MMIKRMIKTTITTIIIIMTRNNNGNSSGKNDINSRRRQLNARTKGAPNRSSRRALASEPSGPITR